MSNHTHEEPHQSIFDRSTLPNDVEALKDLVCDLMERLNRLEERYLTLARLHFGQSSEKLSTIEANFHISFDPLTNTVTEEKECSSKKSPEQATMDTSSTQQRKTGSRVNHKGRNGFPLRLTRTTIEHDVPAHQKICKACGSFLSLIGYEEREQLESSIEQYSVLLHKRRKYACKNKNCCGGTIVTAPMPAEPIEKGSAGSNLLAEVIVGTCLCIALRNDLNAKELPSIAQRYGVGLIDQPHC